MTSNNQGLSAASAEVLTVSPGHGQNCPNSKPENRTLILDYIIPPPLKNHPLIFWFAIGAILSGVAILFSLKTSNPKAYAEMCVLQIIGLVAVPAAIRACRSMILDWSKNAKEIITGKRLPVMDFDAWLDQELSAFDASPSMLLGGTALACFALLGFSFDGYPIGIGSWPYIFSSSILAVSAFVAGVGLCAMAYGTRTIWRFGTSFHITVQSHKFGVLSTGDMLLHCCILVALIWSAYSSSAVFGVMSSHFEIFSLRSPVWLLAVPSGVLVLTAFIVCQVPLHKRMIEYKRAQLADIEADIEKVLEELKASEPGQLNSDLLAKIAFFENRRSQVISLPEWPFAFGALLGSISSACVVILTTLASSFVKAAWALPG